MIFINNVINFFQKYGFFYIGFLSVLICILIYSVYKLNSNEPSKKNTLDFKISLSYLFLKDKNNIRGLLLIFSMIILGLHVINFDFTYSLINGFYQLFKSDNYFGSTNYLFAFAIISTFLIFITLLLFPTSLKTISETGKNSSAYFKVTVVYLGGIVLAYAYINPDKIYNIFLSISTTQFFEIFPYFISLSIPMFVAIWLNRRDKIISNNNEYYPVTYIIKSKIINATIEDIRSVDFHLPLELTNSSNQKLYIFKIDAKISYSNINGKIFLFEPLSYTNNKRVNLNEPLVAEKIIPIRIALYLHSSTNKFNLSLKFKIVNHLHHHYQITAKYSIDLLNDEVRLIYKTPSILKKSNYYSQFSFNSVSDFFNSNNYLQSQKNNK